MGELSVRRSRGLAVSRYQGMNKAERQTAASQTRQATIPGRAAATVSETLRQLMTQVTQAGRQAQEGRRTLQSGDAALAEVEENLGRMEELARQAAGDGQVDRAALQVELERLRGEIDRIAQKGMEAGLFQEGEAADSLDALVDAVMDGLSARQQGVQSLPSWLLRGLDNAPDQAALLAALGVDSPTSSAQLLAALGKLPLESSPAAGYLAALYLGAVISGGTPSGAPDPLQAAEGLRQLLELVSDGISPDQALELLTDGTFTSLEDFQAQFTGGTAPGLDALLTGLLLTGGDLLPLPPMLSLLAGGGVDLGLLLDLLASLDSPGNGLMELPDGTGAPAQAQTAAPPMETLELPAVQVSAPDLSALAFDQNAGPLSIDGEENAILRGLEQQNGPEGPELRLVGPGTVTLQQVSSPLLIAGSSQARIFSAGENTLAQVELKDGAALTVDGGGLVRIGILRGTASSVLRLTGGAVALDGETNGAPAVPVVVDGPAALLAAGGVTVRSAQGEPLTPFDIVWKTLLPEWASIASLTVDGRQGQLILREEQMDPVRLWLLKRDPDGRWPVHTIALRGRDTAGHPRTRYLYVRWEEKAKRFQETSMYPNPFTVTGGEQEVDWRYEEETHTLHILTGEVTAIAGGAGTDGNQLPFSGRISLADSIGAVELTLDGVECRVSSGRAFNLGRGNDVTLLLRSGTDNIFESGAGCAGISLGDGTSLRIGQAKGGKGAPNGALTATGGAGGAGIGRDSGAGRERTGPIHILGGIITATGIGGGAGIGGALGAPVGDIRIQGGTVTAQAACCAAAIGAGIQGACGDIIITGSARVAKARGGGPDGDIGGCLFGNCGKVQVSAGTDISGARLWTQKGLSLQVGEDTVTLPRFRVSARALHLDALDLTSREAARAAMTVLAADRRWVTRLQGAYGAMYGQLGQSFSSMYSFHSYTSVVRTAGEADTLVCDIREVLRQSPLAAFLTQRGMEDVGQLLR